MPKKIHIHGNSCIAHSERTPSMLIRCRPPTHYTSDPRAPSSRSQHETRRKELRRIGARPDPDLDLSGLEHGLEVDTQEAELRDRQLQPRRAGLAGLKNNFCHAFELERRARNARDEIANEQEHG